MPSHWTQAEAQQIYRGRREATNGSSVWWGWRDGAAPDALHNPTRHGWICWDQLRAFTWALPSFHKISTRQPQASLVALHHVPATEVIGLNTFAQNIMKHAAGSHLNNSSPAPALCMARLLGLKPAGAKMLQIKAEPSSTSTSQGTYCFPFPSCYSPPHSLRGPTAVVLILFAVRFCNQGAGLFL